MSEQIERETGKLENSDFVARVTDNLNQVDLDDSTQSSLSFQEKNLVAKSNGFKVDHIYQVSLITFESYGDGLGSKWTVQLG